MFAGRVARDKPCVSPRVVARWWCAPAKRRGDERQLAPHTFSPRVSDASIGAAGELLSGGFSGRYACWPVEVGLR